MELTHFLPKYVIKININDIYININMKKYMNCIYEILKIILKY